jgi:transcriptional regulator with XRE-family HTH domain
MVKTLSSIDPKKVTHLDIVRGLLAMHKITFRSIGKTINVSCSYVSQVLHGRRNSHRVLQAVANALGMTFEELWSNKP